MLSKAEELITNTASDAMIDTSRGITAVMSKRLLDEPGIRHAFSTRIGGVSRPPFDSLNLGTSRDEPMENILENYRLFSEAFGFSYEKLALVRHEHGTKILRIDRNDAGRGIYREPFDFSDGLITDDPEVTLATCHADCSAFFLYDKRNRAIGLAHAGWKGMFGRIGQKLAERMSGEFGSEPKELICAVGPCICEKCFQVDIELGRSFAEEFDCPDIMKPDMRDRNKGFVSLHAAAVIQLLDAGLDPKNISLMSLCTLEREDLFYSYRRDGKNTGSMAAFLTLV